jgi:hypothetical protein
VLEPDDRDFGVFVELRRLIAAMAGDDLLVPVDQDRRVEAEGVDAAGDRPDLRLCLRGFNGSGLS